MPIPHLRLLQAVHVLGVDHSSQQSTQKVVNYLHFGIGQKVIEGTSGAIAIDSSIPPGADPKSRSINNGKRVGIELTRKELEEFRELYRKIMKGEDLPKRVSTIHDPFFINMVRYEALHGVQLVPVDSEKLKQYYLRAMERAEKLKLAGNAEEAAKQEARANEAWIPAREAAIARTIAREKLKINIVGRFHSEAVSKRLNEEHNVTAFPLKFVSARMESRLKHFDDFGGFIRAREMYSKRRMRK
ncbi:hypothetical protein KJ765_02510 [Candidatus Micrarchaeota archaeon]|nr:hypothetical protein [Candidatus Micrarchaeota archaeon]